MEHMTTREVFAAFALQGILANPSWMSNDDTTNSALEWAAHKAFLAAEALIAKFQRPQEAP